MRMPGIAIVLLGLAGSAAALPPDIERLAETAQEQLYNLEFSRAFETLQRLTDTHPDHPVGPAMLAAARWWQARYSYVKPDDAATAEIEKIIEVAVKLSRAHAAKPGLECEGKFFLGGSLGIRAHWELLRGNWYRAAMGAREAVLTLKPLESCTDWANEAMFGLGHYEYTASRLPWSLRWISRLVVGSANRDGGLAKLEMAAERAKWVRNDAQATLALILTVFDTEAERALKHATSYVTERPKSPMAHTYYLQALLFCHRWDAVLEAGARDLERGREPHSTFTLEAAAYHYFRGMALLGKKLPAEAIVEFSASIDTAGRQPWVTSATLKRGCAKDLLGDRPGAIAEYRRVLELPDPWRQGKRARLYLKHPFTMNDFLTELSPRADH